MKKQILLSLTMALLLPAALGMGQTGHCEGATSHHASTAAHCRRTIVINKADNMLKLFIIGQPMRHWRVTTGKYGCTPEGTFRIIQKSYLSRTGDGPLGTRWLGLNTLGRRHRLRVGIHGTNQPQLIGKWASLACIRMRNHDVNYLYELVSVGTTVRIVNTPRHNLTSAAAITPGTQSTTHIATPKAMVSRTAKKPTK